MSLATDGSEDNVHGSRNLKNAIKVAKETLLPDESNGNEYFYGIANQQKIEEDEDVDVFSPQKVKISEAKSKKITTSFKCSLCGKSHASKYYEKAKSQRKNALLMLCLSQNGSQVQSRT